MLLSMRCLLAGGPEPEVELRLATMGFFGGRETFFIVPLKRFGTGVRIGDGEMLGRLFFAGLGFFVCLRGVAD